MSQCDALNGAVAAGGPDAMEGVHGMSKREKK